MIIDLRLWYLVIKGVYIWKSSIDNIFWRGFNFVFCLLMKKTSFRNRSSWPFICLKCWQGNDDECSFLKMHNSEFWLCIFMIFMFLLIFSHNLHTMGNPHWYLGIHWLYHHYLSTVYTYLICMKLKSESIVPL